MQNKHDRARRIGFGIHLGLALILGLPFALLGLTGSIGLYGEALDELLNPDLLIENPGGEYQSLDRIMDAVRAAHPDKSGSWRLEMPRSPEGMLTAWYEHPPETAGRFYAPLMVSVNPYTAEVVASRFWGDTAVTWLLDLHTQFRLGRFGWNAAGWLGVAFIGSVFSGLYLWWPGLVGLGRAFGVCRDAGVHRWFLDLHRLIGFLSAGVLLILAFTGFNLVFPKFAETLTGASGMGHGDDGPVVRSSAIPNDRPVGLDEAVLLARGPFPHAELRWLATPDKPAGVYRIVLRQRFEINRRHPVTTVWVDRYSGQIREVRDPARFTGGETLLTWLWPVHTGEALGSWGRVVWFVAGWTPVLLYATGLLRWLIGRGWVRDRAVDFSPLRRRVEGLARTALRFGAEAYGFSRPVAVQIVVRGIRFAEAGRQKFRQHSGRWGRR